jgi:hypothetical protein
VLLDDVDVPAVRTNLPAKLDRPDRFNLETAVDRFSPVQA